MKFLLLTNYSTKFNEFYFDGNHMNFDKFCFLALNVVAYRRTHLLRRHFNCQ